MILEKTSSKKSSKHIITKYISGNLKINMFGENYGWGVEPIPEENYKANRNVNKIYWLKSPNASRLLSIYNSRTWNA
jgi:hypothetical protein